MFNKEKFIDWAKSYTNYEKLSKQATEAFTGWHLQDATLLFTKAHDMIDLFENIINLVEKFSRDIDSLSSRDKLDLAASFIDDLVKFPMVLEWFDGTAIKWILTVIVEEKNRILGKNWFLTEDKEK